MHISPVENSEPGSKSFKSGPDFAVPIEPTNPDITNVPATRGRKRRYTEVLDALGECVCGTQVTAGEIEAKDGLFQCRNKTCETIWVRVNLIPCIICD